MPVSELIIEARNRDIGNFRVERILPFYKKRMVGPFIFLDQFGPSELGPDNYLDVDQHPHIGLATLTYLLAGEIEHRDSLGTVQTIAPGSVNLMTAGRGVTHTERTPTRLRRKNFTLSGYQIWLALPREKELMAPEFHHFARSDLPTWNEGEASFTLIVGEAFAERSPLPVYSHLFMVEVNTCDAQKINLSESIRGELGILVSEGGVSIGSTQITKGQLLISDAGNNNKITIAENSKIFLLGGTPFPEKRYIDWNFVSHNKNFLARAKEKWITGEFPPIPGDNSYIPYPGTVRR